MKSLILAFSITLLAGAANAQNLYMPRNVKQAYQKGTRSMDGRPGKNYWQNFARYTITITATPPNRTIRGTEEITYINNSPDTLRSLVFKLILNSHKPGAVRQSPASADYLTSGIHIDKYTEGRNPIKSWRDAGNSYAEAGCTEPSRLCPTTP